MPAGSAPDVIAEEPAGAAVAQKAPEPQPGSIAPDYEPLPDVYEAVMVERRAPLTTLLAVIAFIFTAAAGYLVLQVAMDSPVAVQLFATATPIPPTPTFTPSPTPFPTDTAAPTPTPSITPTPRPTDTPRPPRFHTVQVNESLFTLALFYGITVESIATANGRTANANILVDEELVIPWPTATAPLVAVTVDLDGQPYIADPQDCATMYAIQANDSLVSIGAQFNVDYRAILAANLLDANAFIRPGDVICIPVVIPFDGELPPTPGPSPTPGPTQPPAGPVLLYPPDGAVYTLDDEPVALQWVAVQDLPPDAFYMVELVDLTDLESYPRRGFTRQTNFILPAAWRPPVNEPHDFRWNVRIVLVTGRRADGSFLRTYGGRTSPDAFFTWQGAVPTPTPSPSATATPTLTP